MKATQIDNFSYLVKQLPKPVALVNTSFEITYVSDTWNIFFETSQNMIGNSITTLFPHHYGKLWNNQLQACFEGKTTQEVQTKLAPSGVEEWFEWTGSPWYDANENIIGAMVQIQDITERRAQEQRYERLLALMRAQSEITKVGTWEYTVATEALTWSEMTKKIYEVPVAYTPNIDDTINFFKRGHSRNTLAMLTHNALHKGAPWNKKLQLVTAKGNAKWVIAAGKPLYKNGKVHKLIGTLQDVTERVQQEIKTEENEQLLRTLIDNLPL
ncbi:MAG: PAS domain-containing protein, partial [Bacteroidota bacterium]